MSLLSTEIDPQATAASVHIVTETSQLPRCFLEPSSEQQLVVGFDCEGVDLARDGQLCIMQLAFHDGIYLVDALEGGNNLMQACKPALESVSVTKVVHDCKRDSEALYFQHGIKLNNVFDTQIAYSLIEEQEGKKWVPDVFISFVDLLADKRYCGVAYNEKEEVRNLLRLNREFWKQRPLTERMKRVAADDVRFLLHIHQKMVEKMEPVSLWQLRVRGSLYCRCFCGNADTLQSWPELPLPPENMQAEVADVQEILYVLDVPSGKMGLIIGKKGANILSIKKACKVEIFMGGDKGPSNKACGAIIKKFEEVWKSVKILTNLFLQVFVIGTIKEVRKAEALLRGRLL